jgi:outer membrane protein TolC
MVRAGMSSLSASMLACALVVVAPGFAGAQAREVTLAQVLARAKQDPPRVRAAVVALGEGLARERLARAAYLPRMTADVSAGLAYDNRPFLPGPPVIRFESTAFTAAGTATAEWAALDAARKRSVEEARFNAATQAHERTMEQRSALLAAGELYFRALAARRLVADAELTIERRTRQLEAIHALVAGGVRPRVDELRANIDAVAAERALDVRALEQRAFEAALAAAVGLDPSQPMRPAEPDGELLASEPSPAAEAVATALNARPELARDAASMHALRAQRQAARGRRWPTAGISLTAQATHNEILKGLGIPGRIYGGRASLYLRWDAFDPSVWRQGRVSDAAFSTAKAQFEVTQHAIRAEVVDTVIALQRAQAVVEQVAKVREAADLAYAAQRERYQAGHASLLELLDAQSIEQSARQQAIEAERDHCLARLRMLGATGALLDYASAP